MQPIRILIADDHRHAREGMRELLEPEPSFEVVAEAQTGQEALEHTAVYMPDVILMDINMPGMSGLEATRQIKNNYPYVKIIMVTVSDDITDLFQAIKQGAQGYLLKNITPGAWLEYVRAVALDEAPLTRELAVQLLKEFSTRPPASERSPLTPREQEILEQVAKGKSNRDISTELVISEHTVKNHLKNIMQKLHLDNRVQLTRYAYDQGWVK
ncbi:response regulator transcription factor [Paenibacillus sp. F411]|uniref:response regulator n=1 Tax=Paenibacillus sp. F411 TaxID=2820239 RepID=UPI001AAF3D7D|nr:response regulator transcription factor [Paenibacillus sp. F411]MBO2944695.1 response regulator transcription factor [Paenibacillus sp. F411]